MPARDQARSSGRHPDSIGRYRVLDRIGRGAMGMVYAAEDEAMGRQVAVKVMAADLEDEPEIRERFYREARITGQLNHRNIVTVFDLGEDHGHPYLVMELLHGYPLTQYLLLPAAKTMDARIDLMIQMCEGLQAAHAGGVIHRDIKPSNLFVVADGTLKILDFGVARLAASTLTVGSFVLGTPEYMSPEQAQGRKVDARSDVFSAGAVFYFILTGRAPFAAPELQRVLHMVLHEEPAPLTDAEAPDAVRQIIRKALSKAPEARYQQCADMLADLRRAARNYEGATHRIAQAALDRYRQTLALIEERRTLGRSLGAPQVEAACADAAARLAEAFPAFARQASPTALLEPIDRETATAALAALQARHNAEQAALAALRHDSADRIARPEVDDPGDLTLFRPGVRGEEPEDFEDGGGRKPSLWRRIVPGDKPGGRH
jgi:serine/threonine-protein kinase